MELYCKDCDTNKPETAFSKDIRRSRGRQAYCKPCGAKRQAAWRLAHPGRARAAAIRYDMKNPGRHYRTKFGITHQDKLDLLKKQEGKCAGCGSTEHRHPRFTISTDSGWIVDHDHATGVIRGILCWYCNVALGYIKDSPETLEALAAYIRNAAQNTLFAGAGLALERLAKVA